MLEDYVICGNVVKRKVPKIKNYAEETVPSYSVDDFRVHFRLKRCTFEFILQLIGDHLGKSSNTGRSRVQPSKQFLMALWILATPDSYRSVADRFGVCKQGAWICVFRVINELFKKSPTFITWPTETEANHISATFKQRTGFPGIVGCIDGCHIPIKAPVKNAESYVNRKGFHSINLQAVCDDKCVFRDCYAGEVGSVHDARVFRKSKMELILDSHVNDDKHILGDSAYPLLKKLLVPFRDNGHLNHKQKKYNLFHAKSRNVIERSFALLKGRFRSLKYLDMWITTLIPEVILACCVLHNICQLKDDTGDDFLDSMPLDDTQTESEISTFTGVAECI